MWEVEIMVLVMPVPIPIAIPISMQRFRNGLNNTQRIKLAESNINSTLTICLK